MADDRSDPDRRSDSVSIPGGFRAAFTVAVTDAGLTVRQWQGTSVVCVDAEGEERTLSLSNVYRRAQNAPRGDWDGIIREFVANMSAATRDAVQPESLDDAVETICVRIGLPFPRHLGDATPWFRPIGDTGLIENMVIDHPQFMAYVSGKLIDESGRNAEQWLDVARQNLLKNTPVSYLAPVADDVGILLGCHNDAYDAARALVLDDLLPETRTYGCFVAVPTRDLLVVLPVSTEALVQVHVLRRFAQDNCKSRPYPISDEVFWVRNGQWHRFAINITEEAVQVTPPSEFMEVLMELSPDAESAGPGDADPVL